MTDWFDLRGITTGLTIAAAIWLAGVVRSRWGRRKRAAHAEYERRRPLRIGASIVSGELRECAEIAERCERGDAHVPEAVSKLAITEWPDRRNEMGELRDLDLKLWHDLNDTYTALQRSKRDGGNPPKAESLRALAARLHRFGDAERGNNGNVRRSLRFGRRSLAGRKPHSHAG